jgi:DNA-binding SARP family transcriptional activator
MRFSLQLLGGAALLGVDGDPPARASQARQLSVLAILAIYHPRPVQRERVACLLWPDSPPDSARHLLSQAAWIIRDALRADALVAGPDNLRLNAEVIQHDVGGFHAAVAAGDLNGILEHYRGPFLDGAGLARTAEFEGWIERQRATLAAVHRGALRALADRERAAGRREHEQRIWERLATEDPYDAAIAYRLMSVHAACGNVAAALRTADRHACALDCDFGLGVHPRIRRLVKRLRDRHALCPAGRVAVVLRPDGGSP